MKGKVNLTVGIPAYNEEANIRSLLRETLNQKQTWFSLQEIIVVSDGSNDRTGQIVKTYKDNRVKLVDNQTRKGQSFCQNKIFSMAKGDAVVILEADTLTDGKNYLNYLVEPYARNRSIGLVQGNAKPLAGKTIMEKVLSMQSRLYHYFEISDYTKRKWYTCGRGGRLFSKQVYSKLKWPAGVPEDVYAHLWCKVHNFDTVFAPFAVRIFRCPTSIGDFVGEYRKNVSAEKIVNNYFKPEIVQNVFKDSLIFDLRVAWKFFVSDPWMFVFYMIFKMRLAFAARPILKFVDFWPRNDSPKLAKVHEQI